jgi:hypothetical protein
LGHCHPTPTIRLLDYIRKDTALYVTIWASVQPNPGAGLPHPKTGAYAGRVWQTDAAEAVEAGGASVVRQGWRGPLLQDAVRVRVLVG